MGAAAKAEIGQVRELLLQPTVENMCAAVRSLEMIASRLAGMQNESRASAGARAEYLQYASTAKAALPDVKRLLESAARLYNRMGNAAVAPGSSICYGRSGLLELTSGSHSLVARL